MRISDWSSDVCSSDLITLSVVSKAEMDMAVKLIKQHTGDFNVEKYRDEYSKELMKLIRAKAKGKRPTVRKLKKKSKDSTDLLEQLKASLAQPFAHGTLSIQEEASVERNARAGGGEGSPCAAPVRGATTPCLALALRFQAGTPRRTQELGGTEGAIPQSRR